MLKHWFIVIACTVSAILTTFGCSTQKTLLETSIPPSKEEINSIEAARKSLKKKDLNPDLMIALLSSLKSGMSTFTIPKEAMDNRFNTGKKVIDQIDGALNTITIIHEALMVEQKFSTTTNIWSDLEIRKGWDAVQKWFTAIGILGGGAALLFAHGENEKGAKIGAGIGISLAGLISGIGNFAGPNSKKRLEDKIQFIDFTRAAFDDIRVRSDLSETYKVMNDSMLVALEKFKNDVYNKAESQQEKASALAQLDWYLKAFDKSLEQIPEVLALYRTMIQRYQGKPVHNKVKDKLKVLEQEVETVNKRYNKKVRIFLSVTPDLRANLMGLAD